MGRGCNEKSPPILEDLRQRRVEKAVHDVATPPVVKQHAKVEVTYPEYISRSIVSLLVFIMAATMRGKK